jgi:acetylglutamate kinase
MKFDFLSESDQAYFIHKASTLVEALPYIRQHSGKKIVIKYGGHAMGNSKLAESFSKDVGLLKEVGIDPIVVHGGGPQIGDMLKKKNINSNFIEGLRVTDEDTVKVVEEVLSKDINKKIVNDINATGGKAVGLAGNKNNLIEAKKLHIDYKDSDSNIEKILDLGFVGKPTQIATNIIYDSIAKGFIPVIAPLGKDNNGNTYNINADTVAGAIAESMKADKLLLLTDVAGILDQDDKLISSLSIVEAKKIIHEKYVAGGMKPKISTCINAIDQGVKQATILDGRIPHSLILELFTEHGIGTQIYS